MSHESPPTCKPVLAFLYINVRILHFELPQLLPQSSQSDLVYALGRETGGLGLKQTSKQKIVMSVLCKVLDQSSVDLLNSSIQNTGNMTLNKKKRKKEFNLLNSEQRKRWQTFEEGR